MHLLSRLLRLPRLSLKVSLILYVVTPLTAAVALTGFMALRMWEAQVKARMQGDLELVARAIQLPVSYAVERNRQGGVEQALQSALALDSVYSAYAYDLEGRQIASAGTEDPEPERGKLSTLASEGRQTGEYGHVGPRSVYSYFVPLRDSRDQSSGLLQLTRRERDFRDYLSKVRHYALGWLALGVGVMAVLVLAGQYQALGRHFRTLTNSMQRVAGGEVTHRIALTGPREISCIAASFNQMLDSIQNAENEIDRNRRKQLDLEKQLRETEKLAAVGTLAAGVAHELGTPLSTVTGAAQRGLRQVKPDSKLAGTFQRVQHEVRRMEVIIRQLLDFSHRQRLQYRKLRPAQIVTSAMLAVRDEAANRAVTLLDGAQPEGPCFAADPIRLEQALVNLLRNAIQSDTGITVRISWRLQNEYICFSVADSGPGISEEIRPRLFEPFFSTKDVGSGTGLGLAVVHGIVEEHRGHIRVGNSDAGGALFEIYLPMNNPHAGSNDRA